MRYPTFEKCFARGDSSFGRERDAIRAFRNSPPPRRSELTERIVLGRDSLKIKQQVAFAFTHTRISDRKRVGFSFQQGGHPLAHSFGTEKQVTRQNFARGGVKNFPGSLEVALQDAGNSICVRVRITSGSRSSGSGETFKQIEGRAGEANQKRWRDAIRHTFSKPKRLSTDK